MIRISQIKFLANHTPEALEIKIGKILGITPEKIIKWSIHKQSLDARKKPDLYFSYTVDVEIPEEEAFLQRRKDSNISKVTSTPYEFPEKGSQVLSAPPIIIGTGPAGLFCGLMLARQGYKPILIERGTDVDTRTKQVEHFWNTKELDFNSNVQFGEGGAGTFSDGKLNTLVKDPKKRNRLVLELFHEFGGDSKILYENKPHIGTDVLSGIVKKMRMEIIRLGGQVHFDCQVTDLLIHQGKIRGVMTNKGQELLSPVVVLAIGHSARDTFEMLHERNIPMDAKSFAVGLRVQHPQSMIDVSQYGCEAGERLDPASYKLTKQTTNGRGVYSFCMCPGGYVVNASSEAGHMSVNGMSYQDREGDNANSAIIVTVTPEDFPDSTPLGGVAYQRALESLAYECANGDIPVQLYGDFKENKKSQTIGDVTPQMRGDWAFANLREIFPEELSQALIEGMESFGKVIRGFAREDALLAGIESRTSSPVRIWRGETFESEITGLYPCGEGAGYAGGITSAAMDGIKVAEAIATYYGPLI